MGLLKGGLRGQHTWLQASYRVDHDHCRQLTAREHVVPDTELAIEAAFAHALVDPFVVPTDEHNPRRLGELVRDALVEELAIRRHIDNEGTLRAARVGP